MVEYYSMLIRYVPIILLNLTASSSFAFPIRSTTSRLTVHDKAQFAGRNFVAPTQKDVLLLLRRRFAATSSHGNAFATINDNNDDDYEAMIDEKNLPKYSQSIPFLARPKYLKLELAGDVGFDPLNFCKNRDLLMEYREAEIKHSRLAMLAAVGWPMSELYDIQIANVLQKEPVVDATDRVPSLFNGGMDKINPVWWGFCLGLTAAIDLYGVNRARTVVGYTPGDLGWDPLNLYPPKEDNEGRKKMQLAEIKHGRLAMLAITAFSVQEFVTGVGIVDETPLFFKPIEVLEQVLEEVVESV